ncbi:Clan SB, family S8, subtilisin-like serine peptidase [Histomonas meleagridis]|uniref:Clan SB, family S8, subtilisin-like serine peptidase n=1 Tax=Histomonas meleagridis TaxID=135588 RepID=UPI00355A291E|nr:Clan SB, family S8, subtilisin-like serine peptidase [Histomonas meleagridis]KAH0802684.1 Clan SB, family S8, subtilisin-like serine peptidase [Histomonas meleagridis]
MLTLVFQYLLLVGSIPDDSEITARDTFHLHNKGLHDCIENEDMNIIPAWEKGYTGKGVKITFLDTGCLNTHIDLKDNFDIENSWNENTQGHIPNVDVQTNMHGTSSVAMASAAANGEGCVGTAYESSWSMIADKSWKYTGIKNMSKFVEMLDRSNADIRSTGSSELGVEEDGQYYMAPYRDLPEIEELMNRSMSKRNGLGQLWFQSAGNFGHLGINTNLLFITTYRQEMAIGSSSRRGQPIGYSQIGCVFVNTASGGSEIPFHPFRYEPTIYTAKAANNRSFGDFSGTSGSSPQVAGVAALVLQANPKLTWRDVQYILSLTATINDPNHPWWITNAAGYKYHYTQGFGRVDAGLAVSVAETWTNVASEVHVVSKEDKSEYYMPKILEDFAEISIEVPPGIQFMEYLVFKFGVVRKQASHLHFILTSPQGTEFTILFPSNVLCVTPDKKFYSADKLRLATRAFFGENPTGIWKLKFKQQAYFVNDKLLHPSLEIWGTAEKPNLPNITRRKAATNTIVVDTGKSTRESETIKIENPVCGEKMKITLTLDSDRAPITESANIPIVLWDGNDTFNLGSMRSNPYEMPAPCVFKDNSTYTISARYITNYQVDFISTQVTFRNTKKPSNSLIKPKPYDVVNYTDGLDCQWVRNDDKLKHTLYEEKVVIDVMDLETKDTIVQYQSLSGPDNGNIHIPLQRECLKCVLTITPVKESKSDPCAAYIVPFTAVANSSSKVPEKWYMDLSNKRCNIPEGILVGQPPQQRRNRRWIAGLVVVVIALIIIGVIVLLVLRRRKIKNDQSFNSFA